VDDLSNKARSALERARSARLSYAVRLVRSPRGRIVAILGEAHLKLGRAAVLGNDVVSAFDLRGVETFQRKRVVWGRALGVVITAPRTLLRYLSLGAIKGSTITDAKQLGFGDTVELERAKRMPFALHVASVYMTAFFVVAFLAVFAPLFAWIAPTFAAAVSLLALAFQVHMYALIPGFFVRRYSWSWLVHPFLGILGPRDALMAAGTVRMLEDYSAPGAAVVVMGRAHVSGYERLLVERYGFTRIDLEEALARTP
jgi:hypothetical protein